MQPQDIERIKGNLDYLASQNAPEEDVQAYLDGEGVSFAELERIEQRQANPAREVVENVGRALGKAGNAVLESTFWPKRDPKFENVEPLHTVETLGAGTFAHSDKAFGDVIQKRLGDRFVKRETDANGHEVITYRDQDGAVKEGYINYPGLDRQDVNRLLDGSLPFLIGGGAAGVAGRAAGPVSNALLQAGAQSAASVTSDVVAQQQGSQQGVDLVKAGAAGVLGSASQLVPLKHLPTVGGGSGVAAGAGLTALDNDATGEEIAVNGILGGLAGFSGGKAIKSIGSLSHPVAKSKDGTLPVELQASARQAGLDPGTLTPEQVEIFRKGIAAGNHPVDVASKLKTEPFEIPTTLGQRTKDPNQLLLEKDLRFKGIGEPGANVMKSFDQGQARAIQAAALRSEDPGRSGISIGEKITPDRMLATSPDQVRPDLLGDDIAQRLQKASEEGDRLISEAWEGVSQIEPTREGLELLPHFINAELGVDAIDDVTTPAAARMLDDLNKYMSGELSLGKRIGSEASITVRSVDAMRRRLLQQSKATDLNDRRIALKIYNGFNRYIDGIAEQAFVIGDVAAATKLRAARAITKDIKEKFGPRLKGGKTSPGAKILQRIIDDAESAEDVVGLLIGRGGPEKRPQPQTVHALTALRRVLTEPVQGKTGPRLMRPSEATKTWNDIRLAYWSKLVVNNKGEMHSPTVMVNNINAAFQNQRRVINILFTDEERRLLQGFKSAIKEAAYKDPNPSGSASSLKAYANNKNTALKEGLRGQAERERFSKNNVLMARIYRALANKLPANIFNSKDALGSRAAKRAIDQDLSGVRSQLPGIAGGYLGGGLISQE